MQPGRAKLSPGLGRPGSRPQGRYPVSRQTEPRHRNGPERGPSCWDVGHFSTSKNLVRSEFTPHHYGRTVHAMRRTVATMLKQSHRVDVDQASKTIRFIPDQAKHTATMLVLHGLGDTAMGWGASLELLWLRRRVCLCRHRGCSRNSYCSCCSRVSRALASLAG